MGGRLDFKQKRAIEGFIGTGPKEFSLLYSFTRDGAAAETFHEKCDNKGPTATVVYDTSGSIYGGYIEESWTTDDVYIEDDKAFLFRLMFGGKIALKKFPVITSEEAFYCDETAGPVFGSGHDLKVFDGTLTQRNRQYTLNGSTSFGSTYDMGEITTEQITNNVKTVHDVEVFSVTELPPAQIWRESPGWELKDLQDLKHFASSFAPPHGLGIDTTNILVIGPVGAGKSSCFNTMASVFRGHICDQAICGSAEQSITKKYRMFRVRGSQMDRPLRFCLCDTMGLEENQGISVEELAYILDGHVPDGYQFNPTTPISSESHGFITKPTLGNKIHCVCFVFDGNTATILSPNMLDKVKSMQAKIRQKGLPQTIVLTKIDTVCSDVEVDVTYVYQSQKIEDLVEKVSNMFGVPRNLILPMKNYEKESDVRTDVSILAMLTLKRLLLSTENHLFNFLDEIDKKKKSTDSLE